MWTIASNWLSPSRVFAESQRGYQEIFRQAQDQALKGGEILHAFWVVYKKGTLVQCARSVAAGTFLDASGAPPFCLVLLIPTCAHEVSTTGRMASIAGSPINRVAS